jgi:hypothetical protein
MNPGHEAARIESESSDPGNLSLQRLGQVGWALKNMSLFDYLVLAGALVNLCVIGGIIGFWLAGH